MGENANEGASRRLAIGSLPSLNGLQWAALDGA